MNSKELQAQAELKGTQSIHKIRSRINMFVLSICVIVFFVGVVADFGEMTTFAKRIIALAVICMLLSGVFVGKMLNGSSDEENVPASVFLFSVAVIFGIVSLSCTALYFILSAVIKMAT